MGDMNEGRVQRRLAAILAADVVGYSRLIERDEAGTLAALKKRRKNILEPLAARHRGRVVKVMGDGVLVDFASAVDAVECAIELQQQMATANEGASEDRSIVLRIGINVGDVVVEGGDLFGDGVIIAARLEAMAEPGTIYVSGSVHDQVSTKLPAAFEDMGLREAKNISKPIRAFRVAVDRRDAERPEMPTRPQAKPSVAVLPFTNMSGDSEQQYFSDGVTEDIITELSRFRSLLVISPPSVFAYKGRSVSTQTVGRELGVHYVVEGSVRKAGSQVRITAQLVEAASGSHLWAERYDRDLVDIFSIQDEVVQNIVATVAGRLDYAERERAFRKKPDDLSKYDLLLQGRHFLNRGSRDDILQARDLFSRARDLDPGDAQSYVGLANTYAEESRSNWSDAPDAAARRAFALACTAVELDDRDSQAHLILAWAYFRARSNFDLAASQVEKAITLNPNDWNNYCFKSWLLTCSGDSDGGIACANQAIQRNPLAPNECLWTIGYADYLARRYAEALSAFGRMSFPRPPDVHAFMAACYAQLDRRDDARFEAEEFLKLAKSDLTEKPTQSQESWLRYWERRAPFKERGQLDHLLDGLRKAGLPE
jgi:adenylate cyclase